MNTASIFIVRHGKTKLNAESKDSVDKIRGWKDIPLDDTGIKEAHRLAQWFHSQQLDCIYSSDLKRAVDTAVAIASISDIPIERISKEYRPWNLGIYEGKPSRKAVEDIKKDYLEHPDKSVPDGESFNQFFNRYINALKARMKDVDNGGSVIAIVTHYRNMKLTEAWISAGMGNKIDENIFQLDDSEPASVIQLMPVDGSWKWVKRNTELKKIKFEGNT